MPSRVISLLKLFAPSLLGGSLAGVPRGRSIPLAKGGVNTPPAERGPRKIEDFVGFIIKVPGVEGC
jgi:hypothetical protein